jgi:hypothetical protein
MKKTFLQGDWGFLHGEISKYKFDLLPRITISDTPHILEFNVGIFCFRIWLTIWSKQMQEFNKNNHATL